MNENTNNNSTNQGNTNVNSPERLQTYLQVATPRVIFFISAVTILLLGAVVWMIFGKIETTLDVTIVYASTQDKNHVAVTYLNAEDRKKVEEGMKVRTNSLRGEVLSVSNETKSFHDQELYPVYISMEGLAGTKDVHGEIILADIDPYKLIFN